MATGVVARGELVVHGELVAHGELVEPQNNRTKGE
jgi:flagellar motor switch/type III secretory pathway protein FliN